MRKFKIGVLPKLFLAIGLGVAIGSVAPDCVIRATNCWRDLFGQFIKFFVPFIIVGLVTPAISDTGRDAGRLLAVTLGIAYASTLLAGYFAYGVSYLALPKILEPGVLNGTAVKTFPAYFSLKIPPLMDVMTALVTSFIIGLGIATFKSHFLANVFNEFKDIIVKAIEKALIPLLPLFIFGIFMNMTHQGTVWHVLGTFGKAMLLILCVELIVLTIQFVVASVIARRNPLEIIKNVIPAYMTALGTASSAATIPINLQCAIKNKVKDNIAGFVVPLCATIHLSGSEINITAFATALMIMTGQPFDFTTMIGFCCMLGIFMVAAPGVPGGAIMAALGVLSSVLGFDASAQALMIALHVTMDSLGTACNVTGDGAIAVVMDRFFGNGAKQQTATAV
jgi:Na+/H+-dicarboxylate symporter